jgi:hypothetical protein
MSLAKVRRLHARARRVTMNSLLLAAAVLTLGATTAHARPVIPGASGFGMETVAGRGGKVMRVTNLNASGPGSLKACVSDTEGARVCVFEVSGIIRITTDMMVRYGNLTIAGQTAPSPGIMIRGAALRIQASDILVQHIRVRAGDDPNGPDPDNRDSLKIEGTDARPVKNVVIDHCSFSWAIDENASIWGPHDNITFSNNIFAEPLNESLHKLADGSGVQNHGFGVLLGSSVNGGRVTMVGNLLAHQVERNPLSRARELVFTNNLVYDRVTMDYDGQTDHYRTTKTSLVGNVFLQGPSYERPTKPVFLRTAGTYVLPSTARVYLADNYAPDSGSSVSQLVTYNGGHVITGMVTSTLPTWNTGLTAQKTASNNVYNRVLQYAGARPADRDSVDKRIVKSVKERTGGIINCVVNNGTARCARGHAGGWPWYGQHSRKLTLPSNPSTVASNGYTNLENWLHTMDQSVQGVTSSSSPAAASAVTVQ